MNLRGIENFSGYYLYCLLQSCAAGFEYGEKLWLTL